MKRRRLTRQQKLEIQKRQHHLCACGCGGDLDGTEEYDHITELALKGIDTMENIQALRPECHKAKTRERIKMIRKADRMRRHHETGRSSAKKRVQKIQSRGFDKTLRKKFDGTVEKVPQ